MKKTTSLINFSESKAISTNDHSNFEHTIKNKLLEKYKPSTNISAINTDRSEINLTGAALVL